MFGYFHNFCNRIILDNCGVDDEEFSTLLSGVKQLHDFKKIIYRYNVFSERSLAEIEGLLVRRIPQHLEELRIENCKIEISVVERLLELIDKNSFLYTLGLVNVNINNKAFQSLVNIFDQHYYLTECDLSWNGLNPRQLLSLTHTLQNNFQLQYLNLSHNKLIFNRKPV